MQESVHQFYGNRLRTRVCGLLVENNSILLVNHRGIADGDFWNPPGGSIEWRESATDCLKREWMEETGLEIKVCDFLFACEFIQLTLHAVELFFRVEKIGGVLSLGKDPEPGAPSLLQGLRFHSWQELERMNKRQLHGMFGLVTKPAQIVDLKGYFKL
jgi:8-oxo-dGTP diphosphatase